jgi:hypothetical protein
MLSSEIPDKIPLPFADSGTKNAIPTASQIGITPGAASLTDGFPPLTFTPIAAGGIPPAGADFNGILNMITAVQQWQSAGGIFKYDAAFSTAIGGYPKGSVLLSDNGVTQWLSLADNNTTNPDGSSSADWGILAAYGIAAVTGLTNANVTLTPAQYGCPVITLAGTLTGNIQIIFPASIPRRLVANNTTGNYTVTCKAAAGTGAVVIQGGAREFYGDGTNLKPVFDNGILSGIYTPTASATLTLAQLGALVIFNGSTPGQTLTLPPLAIVPPGFSGYFLQNTASVPVTIKGNASEQISVTGLGVGSSSSNTLTLGVGESTLIIAGAGSWYEQQGLRSASIAGVNSLAANGYRKNADGSIEQWGSVVTNSSGLATITYPIAFPNAAYSGSLTVASGGIHYSADFDATLGLSSVAIRLNAATAQTVYYRIIGK